MSASDGLLTLGGVTADVLPAKMIWFDDWQFLYAGSPANVGLVFEELRQSFLRDPEMSTREHIQEAIFVAYSAFLAKASSSSTLAPLGLSLREFVDYGREKFGEAIFSQMHADIAATSRYFLDQILALGWGKSESSAMLYGVHPGAVTTLDDLSGVAAIGSGSEVALSVLLSLGQSRERTLAETLFNVAVAKFSSEKSQDLGVGHRTAIYVLEKDRAG